MHPTPHQVFCNPELFIRLLEEQGVENARPKVVAIFKTMMEHRSVQLWANRIDRDLQANQQSPYRYPVTTRSHRDPKKVEKQRLKRMAPMVRSHLRFKQYLVRTEKAVAARIAKWPELDFDGIKLRKKPDILLIKHHQSRRAAKRGRRPKLSG